VAAGQTAITTSGPLRHFLDSYPPSMRGAQRTAQQ